MALERWQRYQKARPCEVCGGYGSKGKQRCKGFRHRDGTGNYCQNVRTSQEIDVHGLILYWHGNLYEAAGNVPEGAGSDRPSAPCENAPSGTFIAEETVEYPQQGRWRPAETKKWFVVYRDGRELTRSLRRDHAELYTR